MSRPNREKYIIVTERDCNNWLDSHGPIAGEQYMHSADFASIKERAERLRMSGVYGRVEVFRLEHVEMHEEERRLNNER